MTPFFITESARQDRVTRTRLPSAVPQRGKGRAEPVREAERIEARASDTTRDTTPKAGKEDAERLAQLRAGELAAARALLRIARGRRRRLPRARLFALLEGAAGHRLIAAHLGRLGGAA